LNAIRIRTRIESETLTLPELKPLIGRAVEIIVLDEQPSVRAPLETHETMFGLLPPKKPQTPKERATEHEQWQAMRQDPQYEKSWPFIDLVLAGNMPQLDVDAIIASRNADAHDLD
jgi:hypothetical protein